MPWHRVGDDGGEFAPLPLIGAVVEQYRPAGDGRRVLLCLPLTSVQREPLRMLLNWPAKIARSRTQ